MLAENPFFNIAANSVIAEIQVVAGGGSLVMVESENALKSTAKARVMPPQPEKRSSSLYISIY